MVPTKKCITTSIVQEIKNISQIVDAHQSKVLNEEQKQMSDLINKTFQDEIIWKNIKVFKSDHGDFRIKDITNFVREQVARGSMKDKSEFEREEIVKSLLEGGGCYVKPSMENKYIADSSEHKVDEAITRIMSGSPGLLLRGLKCTRRTFHHLKNVLGDIVPNCDCSLNNYCIGGIRISAFIWKQISS